jgi:hypothetical protein
VGKQNDVQGQTLKVCLDKREKFDNMKATTFQIGRFCSPVDMLMIEYMLKRVQRLYLKKTIASIYFKNL